MGTKIQVLVEDVSDLFFLGAILREWRVAGHLEITSYSGMTSILAVAQSSLLAHPETPIALVMKSETTDRDAIESRRDEATRFLNWATSEGWCLAFAVPDLKEWAMVDLRIRQLTLSDTTLQDDPQRFAVEAYKLAKNVRFNTDLLKEQSPEFCKLLEFIDQASA